MIIPDANLLIYAHDECSDYHEQAKIWWVNSLQNEESIGIPWVVIQAFTRLMTHPQICANPLDIKTTRSIVQFWLDCSNVRIIQISERSYSVFFDFLEDAGMGGNLSTDAIIAVHAREHSAIIYSNDRDFDRFSGIKWINPL